jgi:chromate transporter
VARYFLRLGATGFGGPIALVGYMQRDLVERRGWFTQREFSDGLAFSQLAPGPLAAQLAVWLGWTRAGAAGATAAGVAFVLPSFLLVLLLSVVYVRYGGLAWLRSAFYGVGAAAIAIMARSAWKLARLTLQRDRLLWCIAAANALIVGITESERVTVLLASGLVVLAVRGAPGPGHLPVVAGAVSWLTLAPTGSLLQLGGYFFTAGAVVFGSGLAIVPFLYGGVVQEFGWLSDRQFVDSIAVSMITPGPVVITVAFIGYLVAGPAGATVSALAVFLPVYVITVLAAPYYDRVARSQRVRTLVAGITAGATGAVAGAAFVLARRALDDMTAVGLAALTFAVLLLPRRPPDALIILAAGTLAVILAR